LYLIIIYRIYHIIFGGIFISFSLDISPALLLFYGVIFFSHKTEGPVLENLKNLEEKISKVVEKAKVLKEEKDALQRKVDALEAQLGGRQSEFDALKEEISLRDREIQRMSGEKTSVAEQIDAILNELDVLEI
jgi:chromosome segregation ATPase